ncbi:TadE/TadG family type IV pilus assembly protein [Solicola gregarius]|uniref:Pilus assembly protein n=1 Tax=Solicola gregarius TaxID=2908642 RepID=A0AA46TM76_9ACTN|nr:pilus assembly protein [Solicola gregarius]
MVVLVPLVLGILQVGLVLHVRNTLTSAASEAARQAATVDGTSSTAEQRAHDLIDDTVGAEYATSIDAAPTSVDGYPGVEVRIEASVPALGLFGPGVQLAVEGHAVQERPS